MKELLEKYDLLFNEIMELENSYGKFLHTTSSKEMKSKTKLSFY